MQSDGGLDGCRYRTDATCKTVANKGISFFNVVLGPCTPPHSSHNPPTTYSKSLWRVQLFNALPRMYVVFAVFRLYFVPLRHLLSGKFWFGGPSVHDCHSTLPKPTAFLPPNGYSRNFHRRLYRCNAHALQTVSFRTGFSF